MNPFRRFTRHVLTLMLFLLIVLAFTPAQAFADSILSRTDYADGGTFYILNVSGGTASYTATRADSSSCNGTLAPGGYTSCAANGSPYVVLNDGMLGYLYYNGSALYSTAIGYGDSFNAWLYYGIAISNPNGSGMYVSIDVYDYTGNTFLGNWTSTLDANAVFAIFMQELFPGLSWYAPSAGFNQVRITLGSAGSILKVYCQNGDCQQQF